MTAAIDLRDDLRAIVLQAMTSSTGVVSMTREQIVNRAIGQMEELGACDLFPGHAPDPANPFSGLRSETHEVIQAMLYDLQASSDDGDQVADWIDQWRAGQGEAGMGDWRWWIGGTDDDIYALDFDTRDKAIATAAVSIRTGAINSHDGHFRIVEARCWNDNLDEGKDEFPFADRRNAETLPIPAGDAL